MADLTAEQLEIARGWQEFGVRLGWKFRGCTAEKGTFLDARNEPVILTTGCRQDIEATWRDREGQPKVQPINAAKIAGA